MLEPSCARSALGVLAVQCTCRVMFLMAELALGAVSKCDYSENGMSKLATIGLMSGVLEGALNLVRLGSSHVLEHTCIASRHSGQSSDYLCLASSGYPAGAISWPSTLGQAGSRKCMLSLLIMI